MESNILNLFDSCKSDEDIIFIIQKNKFDPDICKAGIPFLRNPENIIFIIQEAGDDITVFETGMLFLSPE